MNPGLVADRVRVTVALCRPPLVLLFALVTALGTARSGNAGDGVALAAALVPVVGFLVFAVAVNDLADEAIDRVNLPGDRHRPLASGRADRRDVVAVAATAGVVALASAGARGGPSVALVAGGLVFALAYSLAPVRLAARGVIAPLALPLAFVAVPFLVGLLGGGGQVRRDDLVMLAGLWVAFVGRLLLKDLRDVRGDALFGKRTFLVRHGRRPTLALSGACWLIGTALIGASAQPQIAVGAVLAGLAGVSVRLLVALDRSTSARRDEALVAAAAIAGRGTLLVVLAHESFVAVGRFGAVPDAVLVAIAVLTAAMSERMARAGPLTRLVVPPGAAAQRPLARAGRS